MLAALTSFGINLPGTRPQISVAGVTLGQTPERIAAVVGQPLIESDQDAVAVRYRGSQGEAAVFYDAATRHSAIISGESLQTSKGYAKKGDLQKRAFEVMARLGPVIVRHTDNTQPNRTTLWVSPNQGWWLWCVCTNGKILSFGLEDWQYGLGLIMPGSHDAQYCRENFANYNCLECGRGDPLPGTGALPPETIGDRSGFSQRTTITVNGIRPGSLMDESEQKPVQQDECDRFGSSCRYDAGHGEMVSVGYDPQDGRAYIIEGQRVEIGGLPVLGPGETERQARRVLESIGRVVIRHACHRVASDIELWVELDPGRWLCVACKDGRVLNVLYGDTTGPLGRVLGPLPHDRCILGNNPDRRECLECFRPSRP